MVREPCPSHFKVFHRKHVSWDVLEKLLNYFCCSDSSIGSSLCLYGQPKKSRKKIEPGWNEWQWRSLQAGEPSEWFTLKNNIVLVDCPSSGASLIIWGASNVAFFKSGTAVCSQTVLYFGRWSCSLSAPLIRAMGPSRPLSSFSLASVYFFCRTVTDLAHRARGEGKSAWQEK